VRCEEVRELLPAYVDAEPHAAGEVDVHLASCPSCSEELAAYRRMLADLAAFRDRGQDPPLELLQRTLELIPERTRAGRLRGSVQAHPVIYAVASIGGAAVGATAAAVAWRRRRLAKRAS
jgi:anti-sigma factor RsiW